MIFDIRLLSPYIFFFKSLLLNPIVIHRERGQRRTGRKEEMEEEGMKAACIKSVFFVSAMMFHFDIHACAKFKFPVYNTIEK